MLCYNNDDGDDDEMVMMMMMMMVMIMMSTDCPIIPEIASSIREEVSQ
jgi:hypothetical protein